MNKKYPILSRFLVVVLVPAIVAAALIWQHLNKSLPVRSGALLVDGLEEQVTLARDNLGVVHISAKTDKDAFFTLGYAHAQDRIWQLEMQKRITQGRLSEVFGRNFINRDVWFRTLGLYDAAGQAVNSLTPEARDSLQAYSDGINAWLASNPVLPAEFHIFDMQPQGWQVQDSLAWIKLFALNLSGNFRKEISALLANQILDDAQFASILGYEPMPRGLVTQVNSSDFSGLHDMLLLQDDLEQQLQIGGQHVGSNAWVVASTHSQNQQAILANDPHLGLQIPSLWYSASLRGDEINVTGMTLVGLPIVVFGHNQKVAWGGTAMMTDNQDLYVEKVHHSDTSLYLYEGEWHEYDVRSETIEVRADFPSNLHSALKPIELDVRTGRHGPVISDVFKVFEQPISLKWTALQPKDTTYNAFFALNYADDWSEFKSALSDMISPNLNMFYSDNVGNIGYLGAGEIPIRQFGKGGLPVPGWDKSYEWIDSVPPEEWPSVYNPSNGYIVNANNAIDIPDYPYFISQDWAPPARAERIEQLLQEKIEQSSSKLSLQDMADIQSDTVVIPAKSIIPILLALPTSGEKQQQAQAFLAQWNNDMTRDSQGAAIFTVWMKMLRQDIFYDELRSNWEQPAEKAFLHGLADQSSLDALYHILNSDSLHWCDDKTTDMTENCQDMLVQSLDKTIERLSKIQGNNMQDWQWGNINKIDYGHFPLSGLKVFDLLFSRQISNGGASDAVNVAISRYDQSEGYLQGLGVSFRQIMSLGQQQSEHLVMNSTGQSGNVLSENYDDMVEPLRNVEFFTMSSSKDSVDSLILSPLKNN